MARQLLKPPPWGESFGLRPPSSALSAFAAATSMYKHGGLRQIGRRTTATRLTRAYPVGVFAVTAPRLRHDDPWAGRGSGRADYQRRERQRQKKNDEALRGVFPRRLIGGPDQKPLPAYGSEQLTRHFLKLFPPPPPICRQGGRRGAPLPGLRRRRSRVQSAVCAVSAADLPLRRTRERLRLGRRHRAGDVPGGAAPERPLRSREGHRARLPVRHRAASRDQAP